MTTYGSGILDKNENDNVIQYLSELMRTPPGNLNPEMNRLIFIPGNSAASIGMGEQLMYSLGMLLLQMTAAELDRQINNDSPTFRKFN